MIPRAETAHWIAAAVSLLIGLLLLSEVIVGTDVFRRRAWRAYLFPAMVVASSVFLWVITIFSTFSTMHLFAHALWAQAALVAGGVELALVRGKLRSPSWSLVPAFALLASGFLTPGVAVAGVGGSTGKINAAISSGSVDAILAELERAEHIPTRGAVDSVMKLIDHDSARVREAAGWWLRLNA